MNSSILAGERRWASARRGGMTVLGKVSVPKPLNLPSQKLENHGLDPNVEIVPKGTLSWGSRPSSSGSNPWITSSVSPNAEGGTVSPSHLNGRPLSGGSGTRPSTAGSERTHEPVSSACDSNSRPSSASGTLSSNQTSSTSLRPRSAESRPNSSQLSRFADPMSKNSTAWGPNGTPERLEVKSSRNDEFTLSSGDFPTLGSEKENSMKNIKLGDARHGAVDAWRADCLQGVDNDIHGMEKRDGHNHPHYFNPNATPQLFDAWRCPPPMNGPSGVWYGGAPPYGGFPVQPGGFPMEPFPYYHSQIAPPSLANSQPGPAPGLRGPHPKNGDFYRPQIPDAYTHPGMPFRPGFYRGPPGPPGPMAFEGYHRPLMGCERDIPYMGMAAAPPVCNSTYPGPVPGISNSHDRNGRHLPGETSSEQVHLRDGETWEHNPQPDISFPDRSHLSMISTQNNECSAEKEFVHAKMRIPSEKLFHSSDYGVHSIDRVKVKSYEGTGNAKVVHDNWMNASEGVPSFPAEVPPIIFGSEKDSSLLTGAKSSFLMHKIDGFNAEIRVSAGQNVSSHSHNNNVGEVSHAVGSFERTPRNVGSGPHEVIVPASDKLIQHVTVMSRRPHQDGQGRIGHRGKAKFNDQDDDGWWKKRHTTESCGKIEDTLVDTLHTYDSSDIKAQIPNQRVKVRDMAKQRALQLQKEEEDRIKEQKAKALAKLEELNRRTLAGEGTEKLEKGQVINDILDGKDEYDVVSEPVMPKILHIETDVTTLPLHDDDAYDVGARKAALLSNDGCLSRHKLMGYKQKQNSSLQKSLAEKSISDVTAKQQGDHTNVVTNDDITRDEHPSSEIKPRESNIANIVAEVPVLQEKKNNRHGKNKHKQVETPFPPVEANIYPGKALVEKVVTHGSLSKLDNSLLESIETGRAVKAREGSSLLNEESHSKVSSQWRPHSNRQSRNQQANKKPHGGEVVWAPIRTQNKATKASVEAIPNSVHDSANPTTGDNHVSHMDLKDKRAEIERGVPKPGAKELAQQRNVLSLPSNVASSRSNDGPDREINEGDLTCNKHKKNHETWKHRRPPDSSYMKGGYIGTPSTYMPVKEIQEREESGQSVKGRIDIASADLGTGRGKKNETRSPTTSIRNNIDTDTTFAGEVDRNPIDTTVVSKDNRASSHWKPKPSSNSANNQSLTTEISGSAGLKKGKGRLYLPNQDPVGPCEASPPPAVNENVHLECNVRSGSRRNDRHNNNRSFRGRDNNNARGTWNSRHDNIPHNVSLVANNRQSHSTHYECKSIGPFKGNNKEEKVNEMVDGADITCQKHRERGPTQPRRGGSYNRRQNRPSAHVDLGWE